MTANTTKEASFDPRNVDFEGFAREVSALRREIKASLGEEDIAHLKKMERWGKAFSIVGYATAGIAPNPVSAVCLALGRSTRWMLMHHIGHKGYDQVPGIPDKYTSKVFAMGSRRFLDWPEWMVPEAWNYEHNVLHHSFTGELKDPDLVERNMQVFHDLGLPRVAAYGAFAVYALSWKFSYYAPNTLRTWLHRRVNNGSPSESPSDLEITWKDLFKHCYGPYGALAFGVVPALYLPFGVGAWASALTNMVAAEAIANVHTFLVIGPNHAGDDLYRFDDKPASRAEGYVRQVVGSVNYATGDDVTDFAHLWLNYQIEHHLFPELPMRQYQLVQPKLKALCEKYGIPYVQESVWKRAKKMLDIFVGKAKMMRSPSAPWQDAAPLAAE